MKKAVIALCTMFIITFWSSVCLAEEPVKTDLSLSQAIEMALKNSDGVKKSALDIDKAEEKRDNASDKVKYIPIGSSDNPAAEAAWYSLLSENLSWEMSKKSRTAEEDRLVLGVAQKYWNVQKSSESLKNKELSVQMAEFTFRRVQAMLRLGMTPPEYSSMSPDGALAAAQSSLNNAKSDLETARNKLNTDYEAFNQALGLSVKERPILNEGVVFEPLSGDIDLGVAVQQVISKSPSIWLAEEKINLAKYAYDMMFATGQYTPYEVRKIEKQQAELDAASAKDATDLAIRSLYYTVRNLEAARPVLEKSVAAAEESLRVAKLQYDLGMITRENMVKAELALADTKQKLLELTQQHAYMKLSFEKPWAVSAGS